MERTHPYYREVTDALMELEQTAQVHRQREILARLIACVISREAEKREAAG